LSARFGVRTLAEIPVLKQFSGDMRSYQANGYIQQATDGLLQEVGRIQVSPSDLKDAGFHDGKVVLVFNDDREMSAKAFDLRANCGCALCVSEATGQRLVDIKKIPQDISPVEILPLGNYAVGISWSDGHASGIYPYSMFN
jgi:DUF971 family protein